MSVLGPDSVMGPSKKAIKAWQRALMRLQVESTRSPPVVDITSLSPPPQLQILATLGFVAPPNLSEGFRAGDTGLMQSELQQDK